jgi:hypothetical protein
MITGSETEEMPQVKQARPIWFKVLGRRLSVTLMMLLGLLVFCTAVGIDSLQQAAAADMPAQSLAPLRTTAPVAPLRSSPLSHPRQSISKSINFTGTYLEFDEATAQRLSHSDLVGSQLTRSRLTSSHLLLHNAR